MSIYGINVHGDVTNLKQGGFFTNGSNPPGIFRTDRMFVGEGQLFDGATRNNNSNLQAWVHSGDEGNNIFLPATETTLAVGISDTATTIEVVDASGLPFTGHIKVGDEAIGYTSVVANTLTGCTRGQLETTAASHLAGAAVQKQKGPFGSRLQWAQTQAQLGVGTKNGIAVSGYAINTNSDAFGLAGFARLEAGGMGDGAWGLYLEGVRAAGTEGYGSVWAAELAVMKFDSDPGSVSRRGGTPYNQGFGGQTIGLMIQSGGGSSNARKADNPIVIAKGASAFWRGIVIEDGTIVPPIGGISEALLLPWAYAVSWYGVDDGNRAMMLYSSINDDSKAQRLLFDDDGMVWRREAGTPLWGAAMSLTSVNYPWMSPSDAGEGIRLGADGADEDIDVLISPKGAGRFGITYAAIVTTDAGNALLDRQVEIVDGNGDTVFLHGSSASF